MSHDKDLKYKGNCKLFLLLSPTEDVYERSIRDQLLGTIQVHYPWLPLNMSGLNDHNSKNEYDS